MFAIVNYNNNQYKVSEGQIIKLPDFEYDEKNKNIVFNQVLLISDNGKVTVGKPNIDKAQVAAKVLNKTKSNKIRVFKFRAKKRYKKTAGQRSNFVLIQIEKINLK